MIFNRTLALAAAVVLPLFATPSAQASVFNLSYVFSAANVVSASFEGTLAGDHNTFTVSSIDSLLVNGVATTQPLTLYSTDYLVGLSERSAPTLTLDGSVVDLYVTGSADAVAFAVGDNFAKIVGVSVAAATTGFGGNGFSTPFVVSNYSASVESAAIASGVPELSTWAMMLLGFGGLGFFAYRKSRKSEVGAGMLAA